LVGDREVHDGGNIESERMGNLVEAIMKGNAALVSHGYCEVKAVK